MGKIYKHPLYERADTLKSAFLLNGFSLYDDGFTPEAEASEWDFCPIHSSSHSNLQTIPLENGQYHLRPRLLPAQLNKLSHTLPIRTILCGKIYDGNDVSHPCHISLEGVLASTDTTWKDYGKLWNRIAKQIYGIDASASLLPTGTDCWQIQVKLGDDEFILGETGTAVPLAKALLGTEGDEIRTWIFSLDVDAVTIHDYHLDGRDELYSPLVSFLSAYENGSPSLGDHFENKAADLLRKKGYLEFSGLKIYEADCYKKMNMIQESWDTNNRGVQLKESLGPYCGLPTVLTPSLEEALSANYRAGEKSARIFEIGHIFLPDSKNGKPIEKLSLSLGVYDPDLDKASFKKGVDQYLTELGIQNHFFIPTDMAIAYNTSDCWLILDEKMSYLETNFGSISPKALENHQIGTQAYMLQMELAPIERKEEEEYRFVPPELT